ncbi:MAG: anthranilate synthase component II [Methyloligellaceae bacterium]
MIILIDNYDSFTYNLVHFLGELGAKCEVHRNDQITVDEVIGKSPKAIVLSPGPCDPDQAGICLELVERAGPEIPLLGVCLGHQTIGQVYGGKVIRAPELMHGKVSDIHNKGKSIFAGLPKTFTGTRYHSLIVERESLPKSLKITAETEDGLIMGMQHTKHPVHGVQFHPESIASEHGHALLDNFLKIAGIAKVAKPTKRPANRNVKKKLKKSA